MPEEADFPRPSRLILDPSLLFSERILGWLETPTMQEHLVVSQALRDRMTDPGQLAGDLAEFGVPDVDLDLIEAVRDSVEAAGIRTFSFEEARASDRLPPGAREICEALLENGEPLADVLADEWAFLTSQSFAALSEKANRALGAFTRAGATVIGVTKARYVDGLNAARGTIPDPVLNAMKALHDHVGEAPVFLLAGGGVASHLAAAVIVPPVGIAIGATEMLLAGNAVLAGDP